MGRIIDVKVKPDQGYESIDEENGVFIVNLKSKAEGGKANLELIKLLSKHFKSKVRILRGLKSKKKIIEIIN